MTTVDEKLFHECFQSLNNIIWGTILLPKPPFSGGFRLFLYGTKMPEDYDCCCRTETLVTPEDIFKADSLIRQDKKEKKKRKKKDKRWIVGYHDDFLGKSHSHSS